MIEVTFHESSQVQDSLLKFAVIAARHNNKWVFCRHKQRSTWEIPGGHRERGEGISHTALRELQEETGTIEAEIRPVTVYAVTKDGVTTYGMLFLAEITAMGSLTETTEIGEILLSETLPTQLTYPAIQPHLFHYLEEHPQ